MTDPTPRWKISLPGITGVLLVLATIALAISAFLQQRTSQSQTEVQRAATRANIAPSYGGLSPAGWPILGLTNTGDIPARDVTVAISHGVLPTAHDLADFCAAAKVEGELLTIHPGASDEHHVEPPKFDAEGNLPGLFYICGLIDYRDDLGAGVPSPFCISLGADDLQDEAKIQNQDHTKCAVPPRTDPT
jgi:hypothetical protein